MVPKQAAEPSLLSTGIVGLDIVLHGGLTRGGFFTIEGDTGAGKTTLCLQFLLAGVAAGERALIVTLSESADELRQMAQSHEWNLEGIEILELIPSADSLSPDASYTMFHPSEVDLIETTRAILAAAERIKPSRVVLDSVGELRMLAQSPLRYRRQILALRNFFNRDQATLLVVDEERSEKVELAISSIASGILTLEREASEYGVFRRRLQVLKMRGRQVSEGYHDCRIRRGGLQVYPRLVAAEHETSFARESIQSGLPGLDALLGGGLARGTSTLIIGPAGSGKSSLAAQYARAAAVRGSHAAFFLFDESIATFVERSAGLGFDVQPMLDAGTLTLRHIDPAELTAGEFAHFVRTTVEQHDTRVLVIDSLTGYLNAMPNEKLLTLQLHELLSYLGRKGVTTIMVIAEHGFVGPASDVPIDATYLADTVLLLRYFEVQSALSIAISVIKKRTGSHERSVRELRFEKGGIVIGDPVPNGVGILSGSPQLSGNLTKGPRARAKREK